MAASSSAYSLSVVIPVFKCDTCLRALTTRLVPVLEAVTERYEIVFVDDRSPDGAWGTIKALRDAQPGVRGIRLSRNFGQHVAITAGLAAAQGDIIIVMDCDLQDPPEMIPALLSKLEEGHDLVLTRRMGLSQGFLRVALSRVYFWLLSRLAEGRIDGNYGTFSILRRNVVEAFLRFNEPGQHYIFLLRWLGFDAGELEYRKEDRVSGVSAYTWRGLLRHSFRGIFFQSPVLLDWIAGAGFAIALVGVLLGIFFVVRDLFVTAVPGWTSLIVLMLFSTGTILATLGVVASYVGRIFEQVKQRPSYVVDTTLERKSNWNETGAIHTLSRTASPKPVAP